MLVSLKSSTLLALLASVMPVAIATAHAASVPVGFVDRTIGSGFTSPTSLTVLPDGRVLVVQQSGVIHLFEHDVMAAESFWEAPDVDSMSERGCLGIVADPDFATNHFIYLYCTIQSQSSNNQVIRVTEDGGHVLAGSERVLLTLPPVSSNWHIGGALRFGPDGMLYVAVGNQEDDPQPHDRSSSQSLKDPFGKILRLKPDGSVPSDNPFVGMNGAYGAIWSYGYRNPFAFDIQPGTGRMFVGDVGQGAWEEIDDNKRGANYGWPDTEGPTDLSQFTSPFYAYKHSDTRCAVTGGAFYNPKSSEFPDSYTGKYLFEDFCGGTIEVLDPTTAEVRAFVTGIGYPTNLAVAPDGSIYYLARNQDTETHDPGVGTVGKIVYTGSMAPRIARQPMDQTILLGSPVTFTVEVAGAESIQWQRDGEDIPDAVDSTYKLAMTTESDDGAVFTVIATNASGMTVSSPAHLKVTTNRPPTAAITAPAQSPEYSAGDMLSFTGAGDDPEDGTLPDSAFSWQIDFQHDSHTHPLLGPIMGKRTITLPVPELEAGAANTWVRVHLTVRDSGGASGSVARDVYPRLQLSSLTPLEPTMNGSGPYERDHSNGGEGIDGQPLSIGGMAFPKGLGVHAPSELRFHLDGRCSGKFLTDVGVDDEVGDKGSVVFQVFLDDKQVYDSGVKRGSDMRSNVDVDVNGAKQLRLVVTDAGDGKDSDHADWAAARITGCSDAMTDQSSTMTMKPPPAADSGMKPSTSGAMDAGMPAQPDASTPAEPAQNETTGNTDAGATHADAGTGTPTAKHKDSGCSVTRVHSSNHGAAAHCALLLLCGWIVRVRRSRRGC